MRKVYIDEGRLIDLLCESEWNFHISRDGSHDMRPYGSDTRFSMCGRETGHFGSGTYFSTYRGEKFSSSYGEKSLNFNPNFINISGKIFRVDFDLYKNLYRVTSKRHGDILYTMCYDLNRMYNRVHHPYNGIRGEFVASAAEYSNSSLYQRISRNAEALGLRCPSYMELTRMCQRHDGIQSFSTLFMEFNGFNGVNVSGINFYDNTKHGSVIYDLSKVSDEMREVDINIPYTWKNPSYNDSVVYDEYRDYEIAALRGEYISWYEKLGSMDERRALRILKNYTSSGHILSPFKMLEMDMGLLKRYLGILYSAVMKGIDVKGDYVDGGSVDVSHLFSSDNPILEEIRGKYSRYYVEAIDKVGAYCWVNVKGILEDLLWRFDYELPWDISSSDEKSLKSGYLKKLMGYLKRPLTSDEEAFIKEEYYDEEGK